MYRTKSIRNRGRVDHKNSFLDSHNIEKERGITVFSDQAIFDYKDSTYYLVDTPGHVDFSSEMERAIQIMDYAIIIISGVEGVQGQTEVIWQLLRKHKIPTFFFINKIDRVGANIQTVLEEIMLSLTRDVCFIKEDFSNAEMTQEIIEFVAERDDMLFEKYLEEGYEKELWLGSMKKMIKENKLFPCLSGSALQDIGIESLLEILDMLTFTEYCNEEEFSGLVYKIRYDEQKTRLTYIKALSGALKVREEISVGAEEDNVYEKVSQIRLYNGIKFKTLDKVCAGEIFAVTGLSTPVTGDRIGALKGGINYDMVPTLKAKVIFDKSLNVKDVLSYFKILERQPLGR